MNLRRVSAKLSLVVPFALALPACLGEPVDGVEAPPSIETRQSAYISLADPDEESNGGVGGGSSSGGGGNASEPTLGVVFENCTNDSRREEMRDALEDILANWSDFEANLAARGYDGEHNCMFNRLTENGKVHCEACDVAGHSLYLGTTTYVCRSWAASVEDRYPNSAEQRKICWASLFLHEVSHQCVRFEDGSEEVDNAARETLNDLYGQSLDLDAECNQDP